ncbi:hypothetical protein EYC84_004532 [Monilinia fructicola]|uniref:Uncharacterized protein n=1 Tax=Monilinia fructicola TaxID=38448 RepID=A0A5M9K365_MONFR|nr:hypothetical protein EYC84_004532 [Monilinia fructicola]
MNLPCDALDADNLERVRNTLKSKSKNVDYKTIPTSDYIENPQIKTSKCFSTLRTIRILTSDSKETVLISVFPCNIVESCLLILVDIIAPFQNHITINQTLSIYSHDRQLEFCQNVHFIHVAAWKSKLHNIFMEMLNS